MKKRNSSAKRLSTGLAGLDRMLCGLKPGDNIVWQVNSIEDYAPFLPPFYKFARESGRKPVYFRFARHPSLVPDDVGVETYHLHPEEGFEKFIKIFHEVIEKNGSDGYYILDCLTDLAVDWYSDRMLGNFFMLLCPYVLKVGAIAYFSIMRNRHSFHATVPIVQTLQLFLDVYRHQNQLFVHPIKAKDRRSPTLNMIHAWQGDDFLPVTESATLTEILSRIQWSRSGPDSYKLGVWSRTFSRAEQLQEAFKHGEDVAREIEDLFNQILRMAISRDDRVLQLVKKYLKFEDLLEIRRRMIGTGLIGGKSVGMLLARAILQKSDPFWEKILEPHDSFFIGSDVFYTYLVQNNVWWLRQQQISSADFREAATQARQLLLAGEFPEYIIRQFADMLDYFGQSPIIVRSNSLLEDNFGNAFAGKYESLFCPNQGPHRQRLKNFMAAVRRIYASTMSEEALTYRRQRGLMEKDEQMALLVQRVSGSQRKQYFFPDVAGVATSYNNFVWDSQLDPQAGMLRLVAGLGSRAVNRIGDDYPQIIALDAPRLRPYAGMDDAAKFSQHNIDLLDTKENRLKTVSLSDLIKKKIDIKLDLLAVRDPQTEQKMSNLHLDQQAWLITFEKILAQTNFAPIMQKMLKILQSHYQYPVDVEFAANFNKEGLLRINLLQCRPLQTKGSSPAVKLPHNVSRQNILFESRNYTMGGSISQFLRRIIYVDPAGYSELPLSGKYDIARLIGKLNRQITSKDDSPALLMGPGRWGSTIPSLGVPVSFFEISRIAVLAEIAYESGNLMPELSFGTHFFQDLVENDIFYAAIFPHGDGVFFNAERLRQMPNMLGDFLPENVHYAQVVKICDFPQKNLLIINDIVSQKVMCFFTSP